MMTLYSRADDARCHRVRFVLAEKGLDVRIVETDPARPPEDLIDLNPYQTVPTLVDRDLVVYEPGIIAEYLDERFPPPSLASTDPAARAQTRVALRRIEQDWYAVADTLEPSAGGDRRERDRARKMLAESILASEPLFRLRPWFLSDQFSQLDAAVLQILKGESLRKRFNELGMEVAPISQAALTERIRADAARYQRVLEQTGVKLN